MVILVVGQELLATTVKVLTTEMQISLGMAVGLLSKMPSMVASSNKELSIQEMIV